MASTYSTILNLQLMTTGEKSGNWGTITNQNLQKLEAATKGYVEVAIASTSDSLVATNGTAADETSNAIIKLTGTLTGNTTIQCEAVENWYIVDNATTMGAYTLGFKPAGGTLTPLVAASKHFLYSDGSTMFDVLDDAGNITANGTLDVAGDVELNGGDFVFNNTGADKNFTIESDDDATNFFSDGGEDRIGIGTASPSTKLHVVGGMKVTAAVDLDGGAFTWNQTGASLDFRCETNTLDDALFIDGSADKVGFGCQDPAGAMVEINQSNSSGAIACLALNQDDTDEPFIKFDGDSQSDTSGNITTDTSIGDLTGYIRVDVSGTDRWIPYYATS